MQVFAVVENGAELKQRVGPTRRRRIGDARGEHSIAHPFGDGGALRSVGSDEHFDVDGPVRDEPFGVQHAYRGALPSHGLAPQQRPQCGHVLLDDRPSQRLLAERVSTGEPRTEGYGHPTGSERGECGDGCRVGHRVAQARHEHARPEADRRGPLRCKCQCDPHVGRDRGRVVQPGPVVAKAFRLGDEFRGVDVGDQGARKLHARKRYRSAGTDQANSVRTIQPATADGSIASMRSMMPPWPGSSVPMSLMPRSRFT